MKKVLASLVIGLALCVVGVNDVFTRTELYSTPLFSDASLVSYYRLENVNDSKGSNTLTNNNSVTFTAAQYNNGANLGSANTNKQLTIASNLGIGTGAFTLCGWVKILTETTNGGQCLWALRTTLGAANLGIQMWYNDSGGTKTLIFDRCKLAVADQGPGPTITALGTSVFHHVAFTYDGTNIVGYLDGVNITGNSAASGAGAYGTDDLAIGSYGTGAPGAFTSAIIDDFAIFNRALTATEVSNLFNTPPTAFSLTAPADQTSTNNNKPTFSWGTSTDPESQPITYTLKLSTTVGFTEPVYRTVSGLSATSYTPAGGQETTDNSYYWEVIASDGVLETASTQTWQLTVDTQNPAAPVISSMYPDFTTGKITKIYGTGESGTTLTFYDKNGGTISGTTVWDGGNFTFTPTTPLDPGSSVYVKSEDGASNSSQSKTRVIIFETYADIFKDDTTFHGGAPGTSMRMEKDTSYDFNIAVNDGVTPDPDKPVTVNAYVQYNTVYGSAAKPKITLSGLGILGTETGQYAVATEAAQGAWEQLTVTGTPNAKGVLTLKMETFSTVDGAKAWVDDISVAQ